MQLPPRAVTKQSGALLGCEKGVPLGDPTSLELLKKAEALTRVVIYS